MKICPSCSEKVITLTEKCPRCGIVPEKSTSPVLMGGLIIGILILIVVIGLIFF